MKRKICFLLYLFVLVLFLGQCKQREETKIPKYVFLFIGDGMGVNHVNGAEMFLSEKEGKIGVLPLNFTEFPVENLMTTYSRCNAITCSAAAGTAMACGEKTRNGVIGMDSLKQKELYSVAQMAKVSGKSVGILTNVSVDHATPAAFYAHQPSRNMYYEIATDLPVAGFDLYAGSGFLKEVNNQSTIYNLFQDSGYLVIRGMKNLEKYKPGDDRIVWIQEQQQVQKALPYCLDRTEGDLTLSYLTKSAINFLSKNNEGFFMMVEGGKIDWAAHNNDAATVFHEVIDFSEAIQQALDFYNKHKEETLIIVTADHETGGLILGNGSDKLNLSVLDCQKHSKEMMTMKVQELRKQKGNKVTWADIQNLLSSELGFWDEVSLTEEQVEALKEVYDATFDSDEVVMEKSLYSANEPIIAKAVEILNEIAMVSWASGEHSASLVPVYVIGSGARAFEGKLDNTDLPKRIAQVAGYN